MELELIKEHLDAVRRRVRFYYLVHGLGRMCLVLAAFVVFTFVVDSVIPKLPVGVRLAFLLGGLGWLAYAGWRHLLYPLGKEIQDDDIALCVERTNPQLRDRLISALQLSRNLGKQGEEQFNSPELVKVLVEDAQNAAKGIRFFDILTARIPAKTLTYGSCAVLGIAAYFVFQPENALIWAKRDLLLRNDPWTSTHIQFVEGKGWNGKEYHVSKGERFTAEVEAVGAMPKVAPDDAGGFVKFLYGSYNFVTGRGRRPQVHLSLRYDGGGEEQVRMTVDPERRYHFDVSAVRDSFQMRASTDDADTDWIRVVGLTPPRIERIEARYSYPSYTALKDTPADRPEEGGNLKAPAGTRVKLTANVNVPLQRAQLLVQHGKEQVPVDLATAARADGQGSTVSGEMTIETDGEYTIYMLSSEGLESNLSRYSIRATQDDFPTIKVMEPAMDKSVTPDASVPLLALTTDDYGITEVAFFWQKMGAEGQPTKVVFDHQHNKGEYGSTKIESLFLMEMSSFGIKEGDVIRYHLEAADNHEPSKNVTKSKEYNLSVISKTAKEQQVEERVIKMKEELRKAAELQEAEETKVRGVIQPFSAKDQIGLPEKRQMQTLTSEQRQLGQRVESIAKEFDSVLKDVEVNKLMDPTSKERLENVKNMVSEVAKEKSPAAANDLSKAEITPRADERGEKLSSAADKQQEALDEMKKAIEELGKWEDYQEVVKIVRDILGRQKDLKGQIKEKK